MKYIVGIDEAGRGSLAGGIYITGVLILNKTILKNCSLLKDSKKLTKKQREKVYKYLKNNKTKIDVKILTYFAEEIDKHGLSKIYKDALTKIYNYFSNKYSNIEVIFDGNTTYGIKNIIPVIKAEDKYKEVAIASIISKIERDREIKKYKELYPEYMWEKHNGYPQNIHKKKIKELGYLKGIHRKTWKI